ncbi:MAG TPA: TonB-dependent siderophore receptor [Steroidobacteraceae bacterium]|nr:TonB-dependent siderophore receptor [Steroidobacteraceae bacterium]
MRSRFVCLALALSGVPFVHAADADGESKTMETIRVEAEVPNETSATKLPLTLRETPQSVTVFSAARIEDQNLTSMAKLLDSTPGVYSYAWDTERVIFSTRGFVIDSLLYDGVPAAENGNTSSVDDTVDTALFERVEIVRGATGLMTGAGSPAASINLVRKHADAKDVAASLDLSGGSWNNRRVAADIGAALTADGAWRARAIGVYEDRDSFQDLYNTKRKVLYGIVDGDLSPDTRVSFGFDFTDNEPTSNTWGSFPLFLSDGSPANWSRAVTTAPDWTFWDRTTKSAFAEFSHRFANEWTLSANATLRRYDEDLALFYVYGFPDVETGEGLDPFAYRSKASTDTLALDVHASGNVTWFGREHELVFGYNGSKIEETGREYAPDTLAPVGNFFDWDGSYAKPAFDPVGVTLTDNDTRQNGVYAAGRFALADPLKLVAGARFATWKGDHFYLYDSPTVTFHPEYEKVIPYAGLIFDVSKQFSLFASYTEIFKPQLARDVDAHYLDPLDGNSVEFGVKGEHFDGRFNTSLTVFETKQDNVATPAIDPDSGEPIRLPDGTAASFAADGTRTRGFELEASGEIAAGWTASLGWSKYQIEDATGASIRTFTPRSLIRLFTTWTPAALEKLTIGGGVNFQSDSYTTVGAPDGAFTLRQGDVTNVSLMARYQLTDKVSVQLNGSNLLDEKYYVLDEYDNTHYGEPLAVSASVNVRF